MTYDALGPGALDYLPCRYGASRLLFRGPRRDLSAPYVAFIGGTETYGKFIAKPFPMLVEEATGLTCANFGLPNAGIDAFAHDPFVPDAASKSAITVLQVMGAQNMTNRFYTVHPRRNDRFVSAANLLRTIYREVDFADFHYNRHMLTDLAQVSPDRFATVRAELQAAWSARMRLMLKKIVGKSVVLWFSDHAPRSHEETLDDQSFNGDPLFVTREMMDEVASLAAHVVEVVPSDAAQAQGTEGMMFSEMESVAASEMMGPAAHAEAAEALADVIRYMR
ncbi:DUF6473 family protein [Sulfitobacter sp. JB4-11]|uniref:DUF6473 family protein n=1 Tax=Sulfitobacter rhodophyticola TaxID=3238304 RepID=UPI00351992CF